MKDASALKQQGQLMSEMSEIERILSGKIVVTVVLPEENGVAPVIRLPYKDIQMTVQAEVSRQLEELKEALRLEFYRQGRRVCDGC